MMRLQGLWRLFACQRDACGRSDHHVLSCRRWVRSAGHLSPMDGPYVAHIHHVSHLRNTLIGVLARVLAPTCNTANTRNLPF